MMRNQLGLKPPSSNAYLYFQYTCDTETTAYSKWSSVIYNDHSDISHPLTLS